MTSRETPLLLTPGPLSTTETVRQAMLRDWGSRDADFIALTKRVRDGLVAIAGGEGFTAVPIQGSGTFAVEAMLGTFVPAIGKLLVVINGAYGHRMVNICRRMGRDVAALEFAETEAPSPDSITAALADDAAITHVAVVHCETTSGILNPVAEMARVVQAGGRALLVDAMSSFGGLPFDAADVPCDAIAASSNKCLQGAPGVGFVLCRQAALEKAAGNAPSLSLDLHGQWQGFESNGQWRFTPPTHVLAALGQALDEFEQEGGVPGRHARYRANCDALITGMEARGFTLMLDRDLQAPIIVTFDMPADPAFKFNAFYDGLKDRGFVIYPGKLTKAESFRIGCIGDVHPEDIEGLLVAVDAVLAEMGVDLTSGARP